MAAAIATVEQMLADKLPERVAEMGEYAAELLRKRLAGNPLVKQIRGRGLLLGVLCTLPVADLIAEIHQAGVFVVSAGPDVIRLLPNFLVTREELERGIGVIADVLAAKAASGVR
jgi:acetylornithine aminotransferase